MQRADGRRVYFVEVEETRTAAIYVLADDAAAAERDAEELAAALDDKDWSDSEIDVISDRAPKFFPNERVWTGGPGGEWRKWKDLDD